MATFRFEINAKRPTRNNTYAVWLRINVNGNRKLIKTSIELKSPKDFNSKSKQDKWIRPSEANYVKWNDILKQELENAKSVYRDLKNESRISSANIAATLHAEEKSFSFIKFCEEKVRETYEAGNYRTYQKYLTFLNKLKFFINGIKPQDVLQIPNSGKESEEAISKLKGDLLFTEITFSFLNKFKAYLQKLPNRKKPGFTLHHNTIVKQFDEFATLYRKGVVEKQEEGLVVKNNPFKNFELNTIKTEKEKLDELELIRKLQLEENSLMWHCRNYFLFAYNCAGIRAGDLIQLRQCDIYSDNGIWRLKYRMGKSQRLKDIKLNSEAIGILSFYMDFSAISTNYLFPLLDSKAQYATAITGDEKEALPYELKVLLLQQTNAKNSLINKYLKQIAKMAGITKKIAMHTARHSFANIARQKDANIFDISKALGHSDLKITETYLSNFDTKSQDRTLDKVYENNDITDLLNKINKLSPEKRREILKALEQ